MAEGNINIQSPIVPNNLNERMPVTDSRYVKGSPQTFTTIDEMVAFHPALMKQGVPFTIVNYPRPGVITEFRLNRDPTTLLDASNNTIVNLNNYRDFYDISNQTDTNKSRVTQYAPDGPGGGSPVYPYTPETESNWTSPFDNALGHKWARFRDDDVDDNHDGIYDNWTVPIPAGNAFSPGDYINNRFRRQDVDTTIRTSTSGLVSGKYYIIQAGSIDITGNLSLNDIGIYITTSQTLSLGTGRTFKYASSNAYIFNTASVVEIVQTPPRVISGIPNNEPAGWTDDIPGGSEQLWQITGQKSVYGQLKSDWLVSKVNEDPDFIRYNIATTPHPDTLVNTSTAATTGTPGDTALNNANWLAVYNQQDYMATRESAGGGTYTNWIIRKINNESGEFKDRVFKLFDLNLDFDDVLLAPPTTSDPSSEGWHDTPVEETTTQINYVSEAIRFFDRSLKTLWSNPVPYTGKSIFQDVISSINGSTFKYDQNLAVAPATITLQANLYKGTTELWQDNAITYVWKIVYNGGSVVDISPTSSSSDPFYLLAASGTPGDEAYLRANQRVVLKPTAVDGKAVVRCVQTFPMVQGEDIVFLEEFEVLDITDGKDAKALSISAEKDLVIFDTVNSVFLPDKVRLRAYQSNIPSPTYYWYKKVGVTWTNISTTPPTGYSFSGNLAVIDLTTSSLFSLDDTAQQFQFAVSTHATNPDSADFNTTFSDYVTIAKTSSNAVGQDGEPAIVALLNNEAHSIVLNANTGLAVTGEIGSTGRAKTTLSLYEGSVKKIYGMGNDYTIAITDDNVNVTFAFVTNGQDVDVYVNTWGANEVSSVCTITISFGSLTLTKKFSISTTKDAPGAIILDVSSDKGFEFTPQDRTNKTLTAKLYDTTLSGTQEVPLPDANYTFRWNVAGVWSSPTTGNTKVVSRADVLVSYDITVEVYKSSVLYKSRSFRVNDITDGKVYRLYSPAGSAPAGPASSVGPSGNGTWVPSSADAIWAVDGYENPTSPGNYQWSTVYRIKGELGSQGDAGGFSHSMYIVSTGIPAFGAGGSSSSLVQMQSAGWSSARPTLGIIWQTSRYWIGQGVTFDGSGNPSTGPVTGSLWTSPVRLTATDGNPGTTGSPGQKGWSPSNAVVSRGSIDKVEQLVDWVGGEGSKPGGVGQYIGPSGLVSDINSASNIAGVPTEMRYNSATGFIQWKYTSESSGSWRNVVAVAPMTFHEASSFFAEQTFGPSTEITMTPTLTIPAVGYNRRMVVRGLLRLRSDNSSDDDYFHIRMFAQTNFSGGGSSSPFAIAPTLSYRPVVMGANEGDGCYTFGSTIINAGDGATLFITAMQYSGTLSRLLGVSITAEGHLTP